MSAPSGSLMIPIYRRQQFAHRNTPRHQVGIVLFSCLVWLATSSFAFAASQTVTIESSTMQPPLVLGRPMLTWWDIKIQGPGLVVGRFQFLIKHDDQLLATFDTEELTLNGPDQRIRVMLPTIDDFFPLDQLQVDISFRGKNFTGKLGTHVLRVPFATKKVFIALIGESRTVQKRSAQRDKLVERLKFEKFISHRRAEPTESDDAEYVKTIFASLDPADLPAEPLAYCGYDLVVLMGDEFRSLRKPQLEGLLAWIKAGGSCYVEPGSVLESFHLEFLRSLAADDRQNIVFQVDPAGKLLRDAASPNSPAIVLECGIGCAAICTDDSAQQIAPADDAWLKVVGALWKVRFKPAATGTIKRQLALGVKGQPVETDVANPDPFGLAYEILNRFRLPQGELLDRLMPEGVQMVPTSLLALILFALVAMIGPGDYFILGWLRIRKLTWFTFPVATLGVTALTIWLSNSYMSTAEARRTVVVRDVSSSGEIVRTNQFELLFIASNRRVPTHVEKGLFKSFRTNFGPENSGTFFGTAPTTPGGNPVPYRSYNRDALTIEGRMPTQYEATQDVVKWTPQLNRIFFIPGTMTAPEVDWKKFDLPDRDSIVIRDHNIPQKLLDATSQIFGPQAMVACFTGNDGWAYDRSVGWFSKRRRDGVRFNMYQPNLGPISKISASANGEADFFRWIYQTSVAASNPGLFSITRQTAPKGGGGCDDLLLLDSSDPQAWMLVIVVPEKDGYGVYRRLLRFLD